jgi:hypothetical protein
MAVELTAAALAAAAQSGADGPERDRMRLAARAYARLGLPVLPLYHVLPDGACACRKQEHAPGGSDVGRAGKHPRNKGGVPDASTHPQRVDSWWLRWPQAGIGIATGKGIDVIDIDSRVALQDIADLLSAERVPQALALARSGRSGDEGLHWVIPSVAGSRNQVGLLPAVDYRGLGGYVVVAPSLHRSLGRYAWLSDVSLPEGDACRGRALQVSLSWEQSVPAQSDVGPQERVWAEKRLAGQAADVRAAAPGQRNRAVYDAALRMGPCVQQGWIARTRVEAEILTAYQAAGGLGSDVGRTLARGIADSAHHDVPRLGGAFSEDFRAALRLVRAWAVSREGRTSLRGPTTRIVLECLLQRADETGSLTFPMAHRDVVIAVNRSKGAVGRSMGRLKDLGVLETVKSGSKAGRTAAVYRLHAPGGSSQGGAQSFAKPSVPVGDVPRLEKDVPRALASPSSTDVMAHALWGAAGRGEGHGLTHTDRLLLAAMPLAGAPIKVAQWARDAAVSPATAYRAANPGVTGSLAAQGLLQRGPGGVQSTAEGAFVVSAVRGEGTLTALDALAERLGVAERASQRVEKVRAERDDHERGLLPSVVLAAVQGREGHARDARSVVSSLEPSAVDAFHRVLWELDSPDGGTSVRSALASVLECFLVPGRRRAWPSNQRLMTAGVPGDPLGRHMANDWTISSRVFDISALAVGVVFATSPRTDLIDSATGARLAPEDASALVAAGGKVRRVFVPMGRWDWAKSLVATASSVDPVPAVAQVEAAMAGSGQVKPRRPEPSHGYVAVRGRCLMDCYYRGRQPLLRSADDGGMTGDRVQGHINGATLGSVTSIEVSCSCSLGVHTLTGRTPGEVIRQVAWHTGWQGNPDRLAALAERTGDVRPALGDLLAHSHR